MSFRFTVTFGPHTGCVAGAAAAQAYGPCGPARTAGLPRPAAAPGRSGRARSPSLGSTAGRLHLPSAWCQRLGRKRTGILVTPPAGTV